MNLAMLRMIGVKCMADREETKQCNVQTRYVDVAERNAIKDLERHAVYCRGVVHLETRGRCAMDLDVKVL